MTRPYGEHLEALTVAVSIYPGRAPLKFIPTMAILKQVAILSSAFAGQEVTMPAAAIIVTDSHKLAVAGLNFNLTAHQYAQN